MKIVMVFASFSGYRTAKERGGAMKPLVPAEAMPCSAGADGYRHLAAAGDIAHFVVGSKPGKRGAAGCCHIQNVNALRARYDRLRKPLCRAATKNLNGIIRCIQVRLAGILPTEVFRASWARCWSGRTSALSLF